MGSNAWNAFLVRLVESPDLRAEFVELAHRYGVDFAALDELSESDLEKVAGGGTLTDSLQTQKTLDQTTVGNEALSSTSKLLHDTALSIISNLKG